MPSAVVRSRLALRVSELHSRLLGGDHGLVDRFYQSGRGYYPPAEAGAERDRFAICIATVDGELFVAGDHDVPFPVQSISKVFAYALALADRGREAILARVGVEPTGDSFNSIVFDERNGRPHNPMVNAGAMITTDLIRGVDADRRIERLLELMRTCAGDASLTVDESVFEREMRTADRNRATAYLMRADGMLGGDVEELLALYLRQCSVHVSCSQLAVMGATLANGCVNPRTGDRAMPHDRVRDLLSVMHTCGMYDAAGDWAFDVGFPAKSGVSGGILAVVPGKLGIGIYSPGLDASGNSARGVSVCKELSSRFGLHVFAAEDEDALLGRGARPGEEHSESDARVDAEGAASFPASDPPSSWAGQP